MQENFSEDLHKTILVSLANMNTYFLEPYKSEEGFQNLHQMKDNHIFSDLLKLVDEKTTYAAFRNIQVS